MAVGDVVDGPDSVDSCCDLLQAHQVITVMGNHDEWFNANQMRDLPGATLLAEVSTKAREFIRHFPVQIDLDTSRGKLLLCHGIGKKTMGRVMPDDYGYPIEQNFELQDLIHSNRYRFVFNGHTHHRMVRSFGKMTMVNAGSLISGPYACFLIADFESGFIQFYDINENHLVVESQRHSY